MSKNYINPKKDLRVIKTDKLLFSALLELLKEHSFSEICITDICEKAMVHRSTFYAHFEDKYHLLTYGLQDVMKSLANVNLNIDNLTEMENTSMIFFKHITEYTSFYSRILSESSKLKKIFHDQIVTNLKDQFRQNYNNNNNNNDDNNNISLTIVSEFYSGAILSVISWWLENDMSVPVEEISKQLASLLLEKHSYFSHIIK